MIRQKGGRIINMSSQAGFVALPTESVYCMTKAAIVTLPNASRSSGASTTSLSTPLRRRSSKHRERSRVWPILPFMPMWSNDCGIAPYRQTDGCGRFGGVPGISGGVSDYRSYDRHRWRVDGALAMLRFVLSNGSPSFEADTFCLLQSISARASRSSSGRFMANAATRVFCRIHHTLKLLLERSPRWMTVSASEGSPQNS